MRALRYFLDEAGRSMWRRRGAAALAVATIAVAMVMLGAFLLASAAVERWIARWSEAAEMSVYLADDITADQRRAVDATLARAPAIAAREYVSREQALARFGRTFPELARTAASLDENPLPASYEARVRHDADVRDAIDRLAVEVGRLPGVTDVRYDRQWIARIRHVEGTVRGVAFTVAALLALAAALTVSSVVRLALQARRQEIEIMQLVGAPLAYIRGPFVLEGVLLGGIGATLAVVMLAAGWWTLRARLQAGALALDPAALGPLPWTLAGGLTLGGMVVGFVGGLIAARAAR